MTHAGLVRKAEQWLRKYRCGIVLSEQACCSGEMPDAIGWKGKCQSVVIECKISRADFLADRNKPWRLNSDIALGSERFFLAPRGILGTSELPVGWGLLELHRGEVVVAAKSKKNMRSQTGLMYEMNLLLASLRRVEVRIEPQSITDFLKWKNRMAEYNGGALPEGILAEEDEDNVHLEDSGLKSLV
jgi:hypothetical protein